MPHPTDHRPKASTRQLRVAEEVRHALAHIFLQDKFHLPDIKGAFITVSEVRISPDLKNATVFIAPLSVAGAAVNEQALMKALQAYAPQLRNQVNQMVQLRHSPKLYFKLDTSFANAERINALLSGVRDEESGS